MQKELNKVLFLALLTVTFAGFASAQAVADVDAVVQKAINANKIPAAGVAVVKDGKVLLTKGYGMADVESSAPANENTVFQLASVTKQFTAAGIMLLVEDGKLKLDDPLGKYVPDVPEKWSGVTVRQLLNQVSGIPNYTDGRKLINDKKYAKAEILGLVKDVPPAFEPGTKWAYSNTNYFLLGMVIEKASGKTYPEFMHDRIFNPLKMRSTAVNTSGLKYKDAATGYNAANGKFEKAKLDDPSQPFAAGAIISTPADMAKWAMAVSEGKLLKKTSWDEVFASGKLADGKLTNYGFGWELGKIGETAYVGHSGGIGGFSSYHVRFPAENLSIVVLVNTPSRMPQDLAMDIAGVYLPKVATAVAAQKAAQEAAKNAPAIADADPETTRFLRTVFEGLIKGEGDPAIFSAEMQKVMFPDRIKQPTPLTGQTLKSFELLVAENPEGSKRRQYRATFESGMKARVFFTVDAQGKIAGVGIRPE